MCDFLSGWINVKTEEIVCRDLRSHNGTQSQIPSFKVADHREFEWTGEQEGKLVVRVQPQEDAGDPRLSAVLRSSILARWKTRSALLRHILSQWSFKEIDVSNSEIEELPAGLLKECATVYASNCPKLAKLEVPKGQYVYASNCPKLAKLEVPNATTVYTSNCPKLAKLEVPNATTVDARNCPKLAKLEVPNATTVDARNCLKLAKLEVPNATTVDASNCPKLAKLEVPKGQYVYTSNCPKLAKLEVPKGQYVDARNCPKLADKK